MGEANLGHPNGTTGSMEADEVPMPELDQEGTVFVGPGAKKEAEVLGLGLAQLGRQAGEDLATAKRYALDVSIKQIMVRQQKAQQENQQKQMMYSQALSLMARIYIGSVSPEVREDNIKKAFEVFGPIKSINMSYDTTTGQHKGFAFLEYEVPEAALLATESMNGQLIGGRNLKVSQIGRPANMPQAQPFIEMIQADAKKYFRVYISSVHPEVGETGLKSVFEEFGVVVRCQLARQTGYGRSSGHRGFGYIEFDTRTAMNDAMSGMNMFDLGGQFLRVGRCITPPEALQYLQPTSSTAALPAAAAAAAAAITAKLMASKTPGKNENEEDSPRATTPVPTSGRDYALEAKNRLSLRQKAPKPVEPESMSIDAPSVDVFPPQGASATNLHPYASQLAPPPPLPPIMQSQDFGSNEQHAYGMPQPIPPPVTAPPVPTYSVPIPPEIAARIAAKNDSVIFLPQEVASTASKDAATAASVDEFVKQIDASEGSAPGVFDPLAGKPKKNRKNKKKKGGAAANAGGEDDRPMGEKFNKLFQEKKNLWEESMMVPAAFGVADSLTQQTLEEQDKAKEERLAQLAITGNVQSMALALIGEDKSLVATGQPKVQEQTEQKKTEKKIHYRSSNRVKDPKKIQPKLNTATKVAAAHTAGAISDAIRQETTAAEDASLSSQESVQSIRGNDARHLLMAKLMRTNRSCILILRNMVGPEDIDEFLEDEIREECIKYGKIVDIVIANDDNLVKIFIRFTEPAEVDEAAKVLNGRGFGGRIIEAEAYDQSLFEHGDYTG